MSATPSASSSGPAAEIVSRARVNAIKPTLVKSSIRESTLKEIIKSAVHQGALSCGSYAELADTVRLALFRATNVAAGWNVIVCRAPCVLMRTRVGSVATLSVPCLGCELITQTSAPVAPGEKASETVVPPPGARFSVLVFKNMPALVPVRGDAPLKAGEASEGPSSTASSAGEGGGGAAPDGTALESISEAAPPSTATAAATPEASSSAETAGSAVAVTSASSAGSLASAAAPAPGACLEAGHSLPAEPTRALLRVLGGLRSALGLHDESEVAFGGALRDHLTARYGSTWQVLLTASPVTVHVDRSGRRTPRPTPATAMRRPGLAISAAPLHSVHVSLPAHFPAAYDPQATPESEAARRRTPERYSIVAFRITQAEARGGRPGDDGPVPHPLDVVGSVRAWWRAQGVSVDGWEALRVGLYLLGAAAALAYVAVTFGYDNRCAAAAGPQGALEAMLAAAAGGARSELGDEALGESAEAVPPLGGAGSYSSSGGRDVGVIAWAGEVGYIALRRFASGLARMPITGDALWALGITGGGGSSSVAVPPAGSDLAAAAAAAQWSESGAPGGGGTEFGGLPGAPFAATPLGCSPAETALAAHRLAWSSALLYALLGCFAAVSLVRILRKNADAMRVRAVVKAMQRETAAARGGGGGAVQRDQAEGSSGTGARQRKATGATRH